MNPEAQEYLDKILKKDPSQLTTTEIDFLKARKSYLKQSQLEEYKDVLEEKAPLPKETISNEVSYSELLKQAKTLGYKGPRIRREQLKAFIKEHSV